jgi:peptidoglycan/xylan/chitin deacetylase (PgdA/CDA1 family)
LKKLALKIDVDTYRGTLEGVPRLLDLFEKHGIKATFFFSLGPDTSGKAIKRVFRKGFIRKVLSASPAASYGLRTMLYGTLLPAPDIGRRKETVARMREAAAAGHAVGIHAWDHVDWHDRLPDMTRGEIEEIVAKEHARFAEIFGKPALLQAAPGWTATPLSVEVQEAHGLMATSDTRGGEPFFALRADGTASKVLEIPSTLPTLDELLALPLRGAGTQAEMACEFLRMRMRESAVGGGGAGPAAQARGAGGWVQPAARALDAGAAQFAIEVHSIHTEIEGGAVFFAPFADLLRGWKSDGVTFLTFEEICRTLLSAETPARNERDSALTARNEREPMAIPVKRLMFTMLPGRALPVATGVG